MGKVVRFRPPRALIEREAAGSLAALIAEFPDDKLPSQARLLMLRQLHKLTFPETDTPLWAGGFVMLSRIQVAAVWEAIWSLPNIARRNQVRRAFDLILLNIQQDTGEVLMTRAEFAEKIGTAPHNVSTVMAVLERMGVVRRERRRLAGVQGPGEAVYFVNPHVAWNGSLEIRKEEAAKVAKPSLALVERETE
jgi:DNA-binding transcriptional regulator YhcF (GntR family)